MTLPPGGETVYEFHPLTPDHWQDFETLFGPRGACGGCWCMWYRLTNAQREAQKGEGNRLAMRAIVASGEVPGLLAYAFTASDDEKKPVGWCSIEPRQAFPALERSRVMKRVDEQPVWSVVCFFVARGFRRQGLTVELLKAAVQYARQQSAKIIEGYPEEVDSGKAPDAFVFNGLVPTFRKAGFEEVLRRSPHRPIMRYTIRS